MAELKPGYERGRSGWDSARMGVVDRLLYRLVCLTDPGESGSFPACSHVTVLLSFPPSCRGGATTQPGAVDPK